MMTRRTSRDAAFSLIELTMAISLSLGIGIALLFMIEQQMRFSRRIADFHFLREEAPQINSLFSAILNRADSYRIYPDIDGIRSGNAAASASGSALSLRFNQPDGSKRTAVVAQGSEGAPGLHYYLGNLDGSLPATPSWVISRSPATVLFTNANGFLEVTLRDAAGSEVTYSGNPD